MGLTDKLIAAEARLAQVVEAANRLLNAMKTVYADERYRAVWTVAHLHLGPYSGPTYVAEWEAAEAALAAAQQNRAAPLEEKV